MKIIVVDNFDREYKSDFVYVENIADDYIALHIAKCLNKAEHEESPSYFRAVEDDYKLKTFEP